MNGKKDLNKTNNPYNYIPKPRIRENTTIIKNPPKKMLLPFSLFFLEKNYIIPLIPIKKYNPAKKHIYFIIIITLAKISKDLSKNNKAPKK